MGIPSQANLKGVAFIATLIAFGSMDNAGATTLYATSQEGNQLVKVNTATDSVTTLLSTISAADSLVFDTTGRIIYTLNIAGQVRRFNPSTGFDELLVSGLNVPADLALEPNGKNVLVSELGGGRIDRINLTTKTLTTLGNYGGNPEGLAFDGSRLFASLGVRDPGADKFVAEIDPVTGAILHQSPKITSLDGLTFDSLTGKLYASVLFGNEFCGFDPNNLAAGTTICRGTIPNPDGLTSDGHGNLFVAGFGDSRIYQYMFATDTLTPSTFVFGLDDLAPASGPGSLVPEPSTFLMIAMALGTVLSLRLGRRSRTAQSH